MDTSLAFSTVQIQLYTFNRPSQICIFSLVDSASPTGCFPWEITIPSADVYGVSSIDQTRLVLNCQGPRGPCCQTHELTSLMPAGQVTITPEGVLLLWAFVARKSITYYVKLQVCRWDYVKLEMTLLLCRRSNMGFLPQF